MSEQDPAIDPVDRAYAEAEALLGDETARAVRKARVLGAVTLEPEQAASVAAGAQARPPSPWRRGGWLAAAGVAVFCGVLAARLYQPAHEPPPPAAAAAAPTTPAPATAGQAASPPPIAEHQRPKPAPGRRSMALGPPATPAPPEVRETAPAAAAATSELSPQTLAPPPPAPPPAVAAPRANQFVGEVVVTGSRVARRDKQIAAAGFVAAPSLALPDPAARLRAAAADGRTSEMRSLLAQGVFVDATDADGDTALMVSIRADQPGAAALLRQRGASLDQKNYSGESARDLATARDDPELDRALGLGP